MAISCSFLSKISSSFTSSPLSSPSYSSLALFLIPLCVVSLQPLHLSLYTNFTPAASTTVFCRDGNLLPIPANYEPSSVKKCSPSIGYKKYRVPYPMLIISLLFILTVPTVSDSTDNYIYDNWWNRALSVSVSDPDPYVSTLIKHPGSGSGFVLIFRLDPDPYWL